MNKVYRKTATIKAEQFDAFLYDGDNDNLDVKVAPVEKAKVTVTKYVEE